MKKIVKITLALLLTLSMCVCMFACDEVVETDGQDGVEETETEAVSETETEAATEPDKTPDNSVKEPDPIDDAFELAAKAALQTRNIGIKTTQSLNAYIGEVVILEQSTVMDQKLSGNNEYAKITMTQKSMDDPAQTTVSESTVIEDTDDYKIYVSASNGQASQKMLITATKTEFANAEQKFVEVQTEVAWGVNDFMKIEKTQGQDGSDIYTCTELRPSKAEAYNELCKTMMEAMSAAGDVTLTLDSESVNYVVVIKDGKFVSVNMKMDINAEITSGGQTIACVYKLDQKNEFTYGSQTITAPDAAWEADADKYTWTEYLNLFA